MQERSKQRIIGSIVLGALILIIIPLILYKPEKTHHPKLVTVSKSIPKAPQPPTSSQVTFNEASPAIQPEKPATPQVKPAPKQVDVAIRFQEKKQTKNVDVKSIHPKTRPVETSQIDMNAEYAQAKREAAEFIQQQEEPKRKLLEEGYVQAPVNLVTIDEQMKVKKTNVTHPKRTKKVTKQSHKQKIPKKNVKQTTAKRIQARKHIKKKTLATKSNDIGAWVVQMGNFAQLTNAERLAANLNIKGFTAYIDTKRNRHGQHIYQVLVGPEKSHNDAKALVVKIDNAIHARGFVRVLKSS